MILLAAPGISAFAADTDNDFSIIPAESSLYNHLREIKQAGWVGSAALSSTDTVRPLSRYEMALETAKAVFTVEARHKADASWVHSAAPGALRALHSLVSALSPELVGFDVAVPDVLGLLSSPGLFPQERERSISTSTRRVDAAPAANVAPRNDELLALPLSQRLRVYGAIVPLARERQAPFASSVATGAQSPAIFDLQSNPSSQSGRTSEAIVLYDLSDSLQLRTGFGHRFDLSRPTLQSAVMNNSDSLSILGHSGINESVMRSGINIKVKPGLILSGNVAFVDSDNVLADGTRFEGGIGLTGWQNRVALSAHLSHLVPEDSMAFGMTAAQLNLGFDVTRQIQMKLLYQQMFGAPQAASNSRMIGGGINIRF